MEGSRIYVQSEQGSGRLLAVETLREACANQRQRGGRSCIIGMLQDFSNSLDCKDLCIIKKLYTSSFEKYLIRRSVMKRFRVTTFQSGEFHVNLRHTFPFL